MRLEELQADERRLVETLRSIPPSPLRERFAMLVAELAEFVAAPSCAEAQADGAPCASSEAACDECQKLTALIEGLRRRLHAG